MPLRTKRWCDPVAKDDGFRLLVCRYRPRALAKKDETWDQWYAELGPSKELHSAFYGKTGQTISWEEYRTRYLEEIKEQEYLIKGLAELVSEGKSITLLCSSACENAMHCHRTILRDLILAEVARLPQKAPEPEPAPSASE